MLHNLKHMIFGQAVLWLGAVAIVLPLGASQSAFAQGQGNGNTSTEIEKLWDLGGLPDAGGTVTLHRRPGNNTMSWELRASELAVGHAYTVWVGNFDDPALTNGGWGAGGLVGGGGQVIAASNHCVWPLVTFTDGGFQPGTSPDCDKIDVEAGISFFLIDHEDWKPGDMMERWDPDGGFDDDPDSQTEIVGALGAFFPPLDLD